jgi:hypothetical protein
LIAVMQRYGGLPALKAAMTMIGLDMGPIRQPWSGLDDSQTKALIREIEQVWPDVRQPDSLGHAPKSPVGAPRPVVKSMAMRKPLKR